MSLRSKVIRLAFSKPELRSQLLPLLKKRGGELTVTGNSRTSSGPRREGPREKTSAFDGFEFFDVGEEDPSPPTTRAISEIERKMGSPSQVLDARPLIKPAGLGLLAEPSVRYWNRKAWLVFTKTSNKSGALKAGIKVQQNLTGKKALSSSDPYLHQLPLYAVSQDGEWVEIEPLPEKIKERKGPTLNEQKALIVRQGEDFFGNGSIRITGKEGAYKLTITPKRPEHKKLFRDSTVSGATFEDLSKRLSEAVRKVETHLATR
jgi:hypothetical protein